MKHSFLKTINKPNVALSPFSEKLPLELVFLILNDIKETPLYQKHELELQGLPKMVEALEYYYGNFNKNQSLARKELPVFLDLNEVTESPSAIILSNNIVPRNNAYHDAMAYIVVLGRLVYALSSTWMEDFIPKTELIKTIPTLLALMPIRNKHAAHRSIDSPLKSEKTCIAASSSQDQNLELTQCIESHLILGSIGEWRGSSNDKTPYLTYTIRIDRMEQLNRRTLGDFSKTPPVNGIETILGDATTEISFQPSLHHPKIINEITEFFQKIPLSLLGK